MTNKLLWEHVFLYHVYFFVSADTVRHGLHHILCQTSNKRRAAYPLMQVLLSANRQETKALKQAFWSTRDDVMRDRCVIELRVWTANRWYVCDTYFRTGLPQKCWWVNSFDMSAVKRPKTESNRQTTCVHQRRFRPAPCGTVSKNVRGSCEAEEGRECPSHQHFSVCSVWCIESLQEPQSLFWT